MQKDFLAWWNERYFHTSHPLYQNYKSLSDLDGDFVYIDFLCSTLLFGDGFAQSIPKKSKKSRRTFTPFHEPVMAAIKLTAEGVIFSTIALLQEKKLLDSSIDPDQIISHEERVEMAMAALREWVPAMYQLIREKEDKTLEPGWRLVEQTPVLKLLVTLLPRINISIARRSRRPDPWGGFFLLALTEHMRERTARPYYLDAQRLLRKLRHSQTKSAIQDRQTATVRVAKFKREYSVPGSETFPPWQDLLVLLRKQFRLWTTKEEIPSKLKKWLDSSYHKPIAFLETK